MSADKIVAGRENKRADLSLQTVQSDGRFSGYASLFGIVDLSNDVVEKGAFLKSLNGQKNRAIRMLFQHDPDQPIGSWTKLIEDDKGLYVEGNLTLDVDRAKDVHSLMLSGALDGLSIGFKTIRSRKDNHTGARHILEADLWEVSVVTFPMLPSARIESVKKRELVSQSDRQIADVIRSAVTRV